ncbi:hypothetical protein DM02DRAFT_45887 [Periconia macrospinosa]|uniref:Uncharacterized protein n=1 Tax=Periconia macrospinosa TaxID=97972 RepID=A0A2V1DJY2_9PLEO|nr:hypothetical protein DM02DRAFT_45887 [Periconia macrospinosa]
MSVDSDDTNQTTLRPSAKDGMRKILLNRKTQLHMLVFRPFLEFFAGKQLEVLILPASQREHLLFGAQKCITYTLRFLQRQPRLAERHYGSWLLARNVWSGGLTLVAACNTPTVLKHLSSVPTAMEVNASSESYQLSYSNMMSTGELACSLLRQWEHESPSLSHCATILSSLIIETRRHHGQ